MSRRTAVTGGVEATHGARSVTKSYGARTALHAVTFEIQPGEFGALARVAIRRHA